MTSLTLLSLSSRNKMTPKMRTTMNFDLIMHAMASYIDSYFVCISVLQLQYSSNWNVTRDSIPHLSVIL